MVDQVVMESAKQNIIKAISHPQNHAWKLDFIQGKGEGQIVLLHGKSSRVLPPIPVTETYRIKSLIRLHRSSGGWQNLYRWFVSQNTITWPSTSLTDTNRMRSRSNRSSLDIPHHSRYWIGRKTYRGTNVKMVLTCRAMGSHPPH